MSGRFSDSRSLWAGPFHVSPVPLLTATATGVAVFLIATVAWLVAAPSETVSHTIQGREVASALRSDLTSRPGIRADPSRTTCTSGTYYSGDDVACRVPGSTVNSSVDLIVTVNWEDDQWRFEVDVE